MELHGGSQNNGMLVAVLQHSFRALKKPDLRAYEFLF